MKKSQYSMEFLIFFAILSIIFFGWLIVYSNAIQNSFETREKNALEDLGKAIQTHLFVASEAHSGYYSDNLVIPEKIGSIDFEIYNTEYVFYLRYKNQDYIFYTPYTIGTLKKGQNKLWNLNGVVAVSNSPPEELDGDVVLACPSGLVSYYTFDSDSGGTFEDVIGNYDGSCPSGHCPSEVAGKSGNGYEFSGLSASGDNSYIQIDKNLIAGFSGVTLSVWLKRTESSSDITGKLLIDQRPSAGKKLIRVRFWNTNKPRLNVWYDDQSSSDIYTSPGFTDTDWHNYVVWYDGDVLKHYVDGTQVGQSDPASNLPLESTPDMDFYLGAPSNDPFPGAMDEVMVWDRALSDSELSKVFSGSAIDKCKP